MTGQDDDHRIAFFAQFRDLVFLITLRPRLLNMLCCLWTCHRHASEPPGEKQPRYDSQHPDFIGPSVCSPGPLIIFGVRKVSISLSFPMIDLLD
jgi:hypothetical protein